MVLSKKLDFFVDIYVSLAGSYVIFQKEIETELYSKRQSKKEVQKSQNILPQFLKLAKNSETITEFMQCHLLPKLMIGPNWNLTGVTSFTICAFSIRLSGGIYIHYAAPFKYSSLFSLRGDHAPSYSSVLLFQDSLNCGSSFFAKISEKKVYVSRVW